MIEYVILFLNGLMLLLLIGLLNEVLDLRDYFLYGGFDDESDL